MAARTCVIIPAFNEEASVASVVQATHGALPDATVLVVDDGSSDDTARCAAAAGALVLSLPVNLGIGGAVQAGYRYAEGHGYDVAVQIDGDGQHDPAETVRLLGPLLDGSADMVVGSRWLGRGGYRAPQSRRIGMFLLALAVGWRTRQAFTDTTSGFRAVGPAALALFARDYPADFPEVETLVRASRAGLRVTEVPVAMRSRAHGRSSIAGMKSPYYMVRVLLMLFVDPSSKARS